MVRIYSDSTCDLSKELCERYNITILPLYIILGDKDYRDGENITPAEIFKWSDEHKTTPKTSAASLEDIEARMKPALDAGDEIIAFSISAEMSNMGNVIRLAAQALEAEDRVHYIDSRNLSTGIGHLVVEAANDQVVIQFVQSRLVVGTEFLDGNRGHLAVHALEVGLGQGDGLALLDFFHVGVGSPELLLGNAVGASN